MAAGTKKVRAYHAFSKAEMLLFVLVFALIGGYILLNSLAAPQTKVWETKADFSSGSLSNTTANADGTVSLTQFTGGSFVPDGVHMFMTDAEAAQMKKNINTPGSAQAEAYNKIKLQIDGPTGNNGCGAGSMPADKTDGVAYYHAMAGAGQCARDLAIAYKYSGNTAYANRAIAIVNYWDTLVPASVNWGGPGLTEVMTMYFYSYDLTRELYTPAQVTQLKNWAHGWYVMGQTQMDNIVNNAWVDYAAWGNSGTWSILNAYIGAVFEGNQSEIDYVVKNNPIIVNEAQMEAIGNQNESQNLAADYKKSHPNWTQSQIDSFIANNVPYHTHCGNEGPNLREVDPAVNGQPYTLKTLLIGMIANDGEMIGDCRHSFWYASFTLYGLGVMADVEQHRHDTAVWGPSGDPWQYTNVPGGQPKLKLAYEWLGKFLGNHEAYPWPAGYDRDQYTTVGSTEGQCGPITAVGDTAFICEEMSHYNEVYARMEDGFNHYPNSQYLHDTVNATNMPTGFASNANLNGRSLQARGDRFTYHISSYAAVVGDLGAVDSSEGGSAGTTTYASSGTITLPFDAGQAVHFTNPQTTYTPTGHPAGTNVTYRARTSCDNVTWSGWVSLANSTDAPPDGRYLQLEATLSTSNPAVSPTIDKASIDYAASSTACGGGGGSDTAGTNLLTNGDFSAGTTGWNFFSDVAGNSFNVTNGQGVVTVANGASSNLQFYQAPLSLTAGHNYHLSFSARSSSGHGFSIEAIKHTSPFTNYGLSHSFSLTSTMANYKLDFTAVGFSGIAADARLRFALNGMAASGDSYYLDDISLVDVTAAPPAPPETTPPTAPTGLTKTGSTTTSISISWAASTDNVGVTGYTIYKNAAAIGTATATSFTVSGLSCATSYTIAISATDAAGNHSTQTNSSFSTSTCPVAKPGDLNGDGRVSIADLAVILTNYGRAATAAQGDLNGDGKVSIADLAVLLTHYGR